MAQTVMVTVVPGGGFEPPTRGFSIPWQSSEYNTLGRKPPGTCRKQSMILQTTLIRSVMGAGS